jgi:Na+-driven multidrug efflux pump
MSFLDEDDLSYDSYAETTINPGNTLFTIALVISVCSLVSVPIIVQLGKCISNSRQLQKCENTGNSQHTNIVEKVSNDQDGTETVAETLDGSVEQSAIQPKQQQNESFLYETLSIIWTIVKVDHETKRILSLAIPFTCSAIAKTSSELVILAIISHTLGNDAMVAYAMTYGLVGITFSFMGGWHDAITSLVSMAYGAENYDLAGAYVQTACLSYILCEIPWGIMWYFSMKQILSFMGFDVSVANLGQDFVLMRVLINVMTGINQSILNFLFAIEHEKFANVMFSIGAIANAVFVAIAAYHFDVNLVILGLVLLMNASLIFFLIVAIPLVLRWVKQFENGLFGSCTWTDMTIMTDVFKVALPIAFGSLCAYAEWEMLTFFAATLGPAEAAAWAVMGFVWDVFESTTEAIGESSELRVAYHQGTTSNGQAGSLQIDHSWCCRIYFHGDYFHKFDRYTSSVNDA